MNSIFPFLTKIKIARTIGMIASAGTAGLYIALVFSNPYTTGSMTLPIAVMMLLALTGIIAALKTRPYPMLAVFLASFVPIGFYMLWTPGIFKWIGIFNLLFLLASLLMLMEKLSITGPKQ